ncbi:hypothetical protein B5V88_16285 [Heyndrickxia sporothermodurans]|uniref:transposase n=1 Tax=Heyndrickxia sporothermodurans TaxID=46224 RepID=UPI000D3C92AC|nr:transposase [Heyndrickxia sporothermodurans]MBL5783711.1 transposase [Heyndrickxia sporothermodurans]MBL5801345.1 transposase [Heyndrickxia sporothermodurans]MBL5812430.1 transposase [Heyndrickxia sporothermodurans]MBL5815768.1 transposase [Heyndrickxia sporothermodurans]MBL5819317.1 transposase [Heyndrickxia sporothermodurans]
MIVSDKVNNHLPFLQKTQSQLSYYVEKHVKEDGSFTEKRVNNTYFLVNNSWNINYFGTINNFKEQYTKNKKITKINIEFNFISYSVNLEIKYVFYHKLFNDEWTLANAFGTFDNYLKKLAIFINKHYPNLKSFLI